MEMSLHRVIAEIKNIEQKLQQPVQLVATASKKDGMVGNLTKEQFAKESQSALDSYVANVEKLRKLKAARNRANSTWCVIVGNDSMTIDEAIIRKATVGYLQMLVNNCKNQYNAALQQVQAASNEVEKKIDAQVTAISGSTKKVSDEELTAIRKMLERSTGREIAIGSNVEAFIKECSQQIENFLVEVDFALSEANATCKVVID